MKLPPLHIALYFSGLAGGGAQRRMLNLAGAFVHRGHRVDAVVARSDGPFRSGVPAGVRIVDVDCAAARLPGITARRGLRVLATTAALADYLRRERPDVVLSTSNPANLALLTARRLAGSDVPVVASVNVNLSAATTARGRLWPPLLRLALRKAYPRADRIVAISQGVARDLRENFGIDDRRIAVIANPVDVESARIAASARLDHPWLAPASPPLLLAVGKLSLQKDFATLLHAFAEVRRRREANLVILGEGSERARLEQLAARLDVSGCVALPGFVDNPFAWMARASVFVLSSAWEGFSNALAEALACGCAVVSTDCPSGPAELLDYGRFGPLVAVGDSQALASAILAVLAQPRDRAAQQARAAEFGIDAAADRYLATLYDALDREEPDAAALRVQCAP